MKVHGRKLLWGILAQSVLLSAPALYADPLPGSLQIRLSDGVDTVTISDNGGCVGTACGAFTVDVNASLGVVTVVGSLGSLAVNVSTGIGYPFRPQGTLDLNSINATFGAGADVLMVQITQTGFNLNSPAFELAAGGTLAGSGPGASVLYTVSGGNSNIPFDTSNTLASLGTFDGAAFSGMVSGTGNIANPYSLTISTILTTSGSGTTMYSGDVHLSPVPEPASLVLLGSALAALALWKHRKRIAP